MAEYSGGHGLFRTLKEAFTGSGSYDTVTPVNPQQRYRRFSRNDRFKDPRRSSVHHDDDPQQRSTVGPASRLVDTAAIHGSSAAINDQRPAHSSGITIELLRKEEQRMRHELDHYKGQLQDLQSKNEIEMERLNMRAQQSEQRIKELMGERRDLVQTITKQEDALRSKEREREALVEQLEKQQQLAQQAIGQQNALRDRSEAAGVISSNVKKAMDQMAQRIEEHKRHLRHTEAKLRKAELARHAAEEQLNKLTADDYPAQLRKARDELRAREERHGDDVKRIKQLLNDEREAAASYMKQLNEANVHATTLEQELLQARNSANNDSAELSKKLDISMAQHAKSRAQLSEFERRAAQRSEEASRQLKAATGVIEDLKAEVARLEREREEVQHEMKAKMRALNSEYKLAKHNFASSVKDADNERKRRLQDTQSQLELVTKEAVDLRTQLSELRSGLVKKEMAWKDERLEFENDLKAAAADFETMQERMDEKERVFQDRIKKLEDKTRKSEATWNAERNNLLGKLDAANKDGFKLREELASMRKDASKAKSTSQADVLRITREMAQLRASMDEREQRWEEERKQVAQEHDEIVAGMKEDYAALEQQLQDDKFTLESQLQEAQDELAQWRDSHDDDFASLEEQLRKAEEALNKERDHVGDLEDEMAARQEKHVQEIQELEGQMQTYRQGREAADAELQAQIKTAKERDTAENGLRAQLREATERADEFESENDRLVARLELMEQDNEALVIAYEQLEDQVADLTETANSGNEEALDYYVRMMQAMHENHAREKEQWREERAKLHSVIDRHRYRERMHVIREDYLTDMLAIKEDARAQMVHEARQMYVEMQEQAGIIYEQMDAGAELADDLQRVLTLSGEAPVGDLLAEVQQSVRNTFIGSMERLQDARVRRSCLDCDLMELKYMAVQGKIVETAGDMSLQSKEEQAQLEKDLEAARAELQDLQQSANSDRESFEAHIADLEAEVAELRRQSDKAASPAAKAGSPPGNGDALRQEILQQVEEKAELEARLESIDYEMDDMRAKYELQRASYESQIEHMHQMLEKCEVDMETHADEVEVMRRYLAEVEGERAIIAEQSQFQINWLKDNYAAAYHDLDAILSSNGGHTNLRQRIKYVDSLKNQILDLKKESFERGRERDKLQLQVESLRSELEAYREVVDVDAVQPKSRLYPRTPGRHLANGDVQKH